MPHGNECRRPQFTIFTISVLSYPRSTTIFSVIIPLFRHFIYFEIYYHVLLHTLQTVHNQD